MINLQLAKSNKNCSDVLVIIPAYNEAKRIGSVIQKCLKYFPNILVINDGSYDLTLSESINAGAIGVLNHCINCGQGTALNTGIRYFLDETDFNFIITFDADGQHLPEDAYKMLKFAKQQRIDAVFGSRFKKKENSSIIPKIKYLTLYFAKLFEYIFFKSRLSDAHNGLRVLSRKACFNLIDLKSSGMAHATEITHRLNQSKIKIYEKSCKIIYPIYDKKNQSPLAMLNIVSDLIQSK
tara:strand:- start:1707 stop:2420 length:714 start_codon:yes stop_codon:yes gene_type:complete